LESVLKDILTDKDLESLFNLGDKVKVKIETPIYFKSNKAGILKRTDRLLIRDDLIEVIDYKTGEKPAIKNLADRPAPDNSSKNKQYLKQMQDYKLGVSKIYPDKEIKCYLVWLDNPKGKRIEQV
jgi:ATP-dependent helicase/nuclease subunit A